MDRVPLRSSQRLVLGALVVALAVAGTVSLATRSQPSEPIPSEAAPPGPRNDYTSSEVVCALLTKEELEPALAVAVAAGDNPGITNTFAEIPSITKCRYAPAEKPAFKVETGVFSGNAAPTFEEIKVSRKGFASESLPRLGQEALWFPQAHELLVLTNGRILGLSIGGDVIESDADLKERARRLARAALARLR